MAELGLTGFNLRRRLLAQQKAEDAAKHVQQEQVPEPTAESDDVGTDTSKRRRKKED